MAESPRKDRTGTRSAPLMHGEAPDESNERLALAKEIRALADRIEAFLMEPDPLERLVELALAGQPGALRIMQEQGIVIESLADPMQKFAFTLYTQLVEIHEAAEAYAAAIAESTKESSEI